VEETLKALRGEWLPPELGGGKRKRDLAGELEKKADEVAAEIASILAEAPKFTVMNPLEAREKYSRRPIGRTRKPLRWDDIEGMVARAALEEEAAPAEGLQKLQIPAEVEKPAPISHAEGIRSNILQLLQVLQPGKREMQVLQPPAEGEECPGMLRIPHPDEEVEGEAQQMGAEVLVRAVEAIRGAVAERSGGKATVPCRVLLSEIGEALAGAELSGGERKSLGRKLAPALRDAGFRVVKAREGFAVEATPAELDRLLGPPRVEWTSPRGKRPRWPRVPNPPLELPRRGWRRSHRRRPGRGWKRILQRRAPRERRRCSRS